MEKRDYAAAVAALNTLQSNFSVVDAIRKSGRGMNKQAIPEMLEWVRRIGYEPSDFNRLNPIHVAGTKGKGSTSAFISSIIAQFLPTPEQAPAAKLTKVGLYTSPHLRFVRERIQINNEPISEDMFAKYFFEVWDRLEAAAKAEGIQPDTPTKPVYFRYLTLMALHTYMSEGVDLAVIECGIGGEYDSTNILDGKGERPGIKAITTLGIDHTAMLGSTLPEIAWHKAGIMRPHSQAFTAPQKEEAMSVLRERAKEKASRLEEVRVHPALADGTIKLGLSADFQKINASLALAVAAEAIRSLQHSGQKIPVELPDIHTPTHTNPRKSIAEQFIRGLQEVKWPGRCEIRREKDIAWHIDGGHTIESLEETGRWFAKEIRAQTTKASNEKDVLDNRRPRILIFNQQTRDANALAQALYNALKEGMESGDEAPFTHVMFTTNQTFSAGFKPDLISVNTNQQDVDALAVQKALAQKWAEIDLSATVSVLKTIDEAISQAREVATAWTKSVEGDAKIMALITGSLHLVGGAIDVLESEQ